MRLSVWIFLLLFASSASAQTVKPGIGMIGSTFSYTVTEGDSQTKVGARFGMEPRLLAKLNDLSVTAHLQLGQALKIDNQHIVPEGLHDGILVNLPQRMLFRIKGGELQAAYPVAVGRPSWPTPAGDFVIISREQDKTWLVPLSIQREMRFEGKPVLTEVPPGPDNPLGRYWLGLSLPGIGIHGTIAPQSIYDFRTHGCIRLHPDDVEALFQTVEKGEVGRIVYQPILLFAAADGRIFLEVHRDIYRQGVDSLKTARELAYEAGVSETVDWDKVASVIEAREGVARDVTLTTGNSREEP
jgi:L,D-transpeptidase ErfK/SrfK